MANVVDLATVEDVKGYLYSGQSNASIPASDDAKLATILTAVSSWIARYLGRTQGSVNTLIAQAWNEIRTGNGASMMRMRARPIVSVSGVIVGQTSLPILTAGSLVGGGIVFDQQYISIRGRVGYGYFPPIPLGCQFNYIGGYNTPGLGAVAALPDWTATTLYPAGAQINRVATGIVYTAINGGMSGTVAPTFPIALGAQVADGTPGNVSVQSIIESGTIVTVVTMTPHNLSPGQRFTMSSVTLAGYNGIFAVVSTPTPTSFTYVAATAGLGAGGGGVVSTVGLAWQAASTVLPLVAGAAVLPQELSLAAMQETALIYKQRTQIGQKSYGTGADRIDYFIGDMSAGTKTLLAPHIDWAGSMEGGEIVPACAA